MKRILPLLAALAAVPAALAAPAHWRSTGSSNVLHWTATWQGTPVKGRFPDFAVKATIAPRAPDGGAVTVDIDTTSVRSASGDVTRAIRGKQWFDTADHPKARFRGRITGKSGHLSLRGTLRLKGRDGKLDIPVTLAPGDGGTLVLSGHFRVKRNRYGIGTGKWESGAMIGQDVTVDFRVTLAKQG